MASGLWAARSPLRRLRALGLVGPLAVLAALAVGRLGLPWCFAPGTPRRWAGRVAGSAAGARSRPSRIARQESVDFRSAGALAPSVWADPKLRLLQALHVGDATSAELNALMSELLATNPRRASDVMPALDGRWRLLGAGRPGIVAPQLAVFSGGHFQHEGSIHNGGLFKAILETQAADVKLGVPEVRIADGRVAVSVVVAAAPGREKTLAYSVNLASISPTSFRRTLLSLDLPEPVGSLTPLMEADDLVSVAYSDDDLLVLQDQNGPFEFLVHESVQLLDQSLLFDHSIDLGVNTEVFFQSAVEA